MIYSIKSRFDRLSPYPESFRLFCLLILQDGLFLVTNSIDLVKSYPLAVLTPNVNEYKRLVQRVLNCEVDEQNAEEQLRSLAKQ